MDSLRISIGLGVLLLGSVSIHYANEFADVETDRRTTRTPYSGGSGALPEMGFSERLALRGAWAALLLAGMLAAAAWSSGVQLPRAGLALLAAGIFFGWMYSLPPMQLAWKGWGELTNAVLGGEILPLYGYALLAGRIELDVVIICLPFTGLVFLNLLATTWPDRLADQSVGKRTLATTWDTTSLRRLYLFAAALSYAAILASAGSLLPAIALIAGFVPLPLVVWGRRTYARSENPFPTVAAMAAMMLTQLAAWGVMAFYPQIG